MVVIENSSPHFMAGRGSVHRPVHASFCRTSGQRNARLVDATPLLSIVLTNGGMHGRNIDKMHACLTIHPRASRSTDQWGHALSGTSYARTNACDFNSAVLNSLWKGLVGLSIICLGYVPNNSSVCSVDGNSLLLGDSRCQANNKQTMPRTVLLPVLRRCQAHTAVIILRTGALGARSWPWTSARRSSSCGLLMRSTGHCDDRTTKFESKPRRFRWFDNYWVSGTRMWCLFIICLAWVYFRY